ncbi:MAG: dockerin type I domain-containing protein, partial [Oscillospiraceae bacterium]|nr:dockerin type I domain-containing protein [Oscillospiraceae bacterium]
MLKKIIKSAICVIAVVLFMLIIKPSAVVMKANAQIVDIASGYTTGPETYQVEFNVVCTPNKIYIKDGVAYSSPDSSTPLEYINVYVYFKNLTLCDIVNNRAFLQVSSILGLGTLKSFNDLGLQNGLDPGASISFSFNIPIEDNISIKKIYQYGIDAPMIVVMFYGPFLSDGLLHYEDPSAGFGTKNSPYPALDVEFINDIDDDFSVNVNIDKNYLHICAGTPYDYDFSPVKEANLSIQVYNSLPVPVEISNIHIIGNGLFTFDEKEFERDYDLNEKITLEGYGVKTFNVKVYPYDMSKKNCDSAEYNLFTAEIKANLINYNTILQGTGKSPGINFDFDVDAGLVLFEPATDFKTGQPNADSGKYTVQDANNFNMSKMNNLQTGVVLAAAAYGQYNAETSLHNLGFYNMKQYDFTLRDSMLETLWNNLPNLDYAVYQALTPDTVGVTFGQRTVISDDGREKKTVIAVLIRGTPGTFLASPRALWEWLSDAKALSKGSLTTGDGYHSGFFDACSNLDKQLQEYMKSVDTDPEHTMIYITGHSRGAAVANMLAAWICEGKSAVSDKINKTNVSAYTYATPNVRKDTFGEEVENMYSDRITNVVNLCDIVPTVPFRNWDYRKYGMTYYFSDPNEVNPDQSIIRKGVLTSKNHAHDMDVYVANVLNGNYGTFPGIDGPLPQRAVITGNADVEILSDCAPAGSITGGTAQEADNSGVSVEYADGKGYVFSPANADVEFKLKATGTGALSIDVESLDNDTFDTAWQKSFVNVKLIPGKEFLMDQGSSADATRLYVTSDGIIIAEVMPDGSEVPIVTNFKSVTGAVKSYNPNNPTTIRLLDGTTEIAHTTINPVAGSGQTTQTFTLTDVPAGTYTLEVTKTGHTKYTIKNITVGESDIDLRDDSRAGISLITLVGGDITGDGKVTIADLNVVLNNFNKSAGLPVESSPDVTGDGKVTIADLNAVL